MTKAGATRRKGKMKTLRFTQWATVDIPGGLLQGVSATERQAASVAYWWMRVLPCTVTVRVPAGKGRKR